MDEPIMRYLNIVVYDNLKYIYIIKYFNIM